MVFQRKRQSCKLARREHVTMLSCTQFVRPTAVTVSSVSRNIGDAAIYPGGIDISCAWPLLKTELRVWTVGVRDGPTALISAPLIKLCLRNTCFGRATRA